MYVSVNLIHCNIGWNELRRYYETNYNYSNFSSYLVVAHFFVMNDLPSYTAWKQDNAQQFKKTPKYDGIDQQKG